jgi:hypothetical protein
MLGSRFVRAPTRRAARAGGVWGGGAWLLRLMPSHIALASIISLALPVEYSRAAPPNPHLTLSERAALAGMSLVSKARVVCRVYTEGNRRITKYCQDGYLCVPNDKCSPGPEIRRKIEAERQRRLAELKRRQDELRARVRNTLKGMRRAEPRHAATPGTFNCSYKPAGGGAAWDAACLSKVVSDPRQLLLLRCAPGETCPRGAGGLTVGNAQTGGNAGGTYTPGTWYTPNSDWKTIPTPRYRQGSGSIARPRAGSRPMTLREQLVMRLRHKQAEEQVERLLAERNREARGSAAWNAANGVLKDLGQTLADNGLDLPEYFKEDGTPRDSDGDGNLGPPPQAAPGEVATAPPPANNPTPPNASSEPAAPAAAPSAPPPPQRSTRDEVYCSFILYRVHSNDLAYQNIEQIPEPCRTPEMREALAHQQSEHPTPYLNDSTGETVELLLRRTDAALRDQAPPKL